LPDYSVKTKFVAVDKMSSVFKAMGARSKAFGDKTTAAFGKATKSASVFRGALGALGVGAVFSRMSRAISGGLREVSQQWVDFDSQVTQAAAKFPERIRRGTLAFKQLGDTAREVGATTQFTAAEAAGGLQFLAMAGFEARQAMELLPGVTNLATVGNMDLARATDIASDALGAFGMMTNNTSKLTANFSRINDVMAKTITSTNTDMEQLFETMKFAGPVATAAGADIETFAAAAGEMAQAGIKGSLSGTALRTMFLALTGPTPKATKQLDKLGVSLKDQEGNMRDLFDILGDLKSAFADKKLGNAARLQALNAIFGRRAIAGVNVLLATGSDRLKEFRDDLRGAAGASKDMAVDIRKSLANRLAELKSSLIEVGFKFIEAFSKDGGRAIDDIIAAVREFDVKPIVQGLKDTIQLFKDIKHTVEFFWPAIEVGAKAWLGYKAAVMAAKVAQWLLNGAMLANPIGIVIAAIVIAVAGITLMIKKWNIVTHLIDFATTSWSILVETFMLGLQKIAQGILTYWLAPINLVIDAINKVSSMLGGKKVLENITVQFGEGSEETIKQLQRDRDQSMKKALMETIKSDERLVAKHNAAIEAKQFALKREIYRTEQPGFTQAATPEYELPVSGQMTTPAVESPAPARPPLEGILKVINEMDRGKLEYTGKGAPGLDVQLLEAI
jgi:TP901 family phage tail tape measure protein